jgi:hypothetical protein
MGALGMGQGNLLLEARVRGGSSSIARHGHFLVGNDIPAEPDAAELGRVDVGAPPRPLDYRPRIPCYWAADTWH